MARTASSSPISLLRAALASDDAEFRNLAKRKIASALGHSSVAVACEVLGLERRALERLRHDFPEAFPRAWRLGELDD